MAKVRTLPTLLERGEHLTGPAVCIQCGHEWQSVCPVGTIELECPKCHTHKGLLKFPVEPEGLALVCNCGCHVFMVSKLGNIICWKCGTIQILPP